MNNQSALLRNLDKSIAASQRTILKEQQFLTGLQTARDAVSQAVLKDARKPRTRKSARTRVAAIQDILAASPEPISVSEIVEQLKGLGRVDHKPNVSSTLAYLAKKGSAKTASRGKWVSVTERKTLKAA
jgi:hypothetical protein